MEQVLQKVTTDARDRLGAHDLHYLDQSWAALFSGDTIDPREYYDRKRDLALPDFDWSDFSKPLIQGISTYQDKLIGIPFDIPITVGSSPDWGDVPVAPAPPQPADEPSAAAPPAPAARRRP